MRAWEAAAEQGGGGPAHRLTWTGGLAVIVRFLVTMQPSRREVVTLTEQKGGQIMSGGARTGLIIAVVAVLVVIAVFAFGLVDIDQTRETALPEVKTEGGQMPAFDVDTADVDVGTTTRSEEHTSELQPL